MTDPRPSSPSPAPSGPAPEVDCLLLETGEPLLFEDGSPHGLEPPSIPADRTKGAGQ